MMIFFFAEKENSMRWTKDQLETLKTFHDKYKGSAHTLEELATRIAKELPTRTKGGIRTKLHRDYGDKTVRQLMKKIRLMPIRERQDLLSTVKMFDTPPKTTVSPYDLPSPPIPTIITTTKEKTKTPPPPITKETRKRALQHSPPKEKTLAKFYKRLAGLYASPSPPKKKPKTKTRQQELLQRMRTLGLRARAPKSVEEVDIYEQLHQTDTEARKRHEKEFQEHFVQAFHIRPADLLGLVKNPMKRTAGRKTRADTKKEQPIVDQVAAFYRGLDKNRGDVDDKLLAFLRLKLGQHKKVLEAKEREQIRKQEEKIRQKHLKERMAALKGLTPKEWNEWQKTFKKDIKDKQEKEKERARILGLDVSPAVKTVMLSMLEWPKAPTRKPTKKAQDHTPSGSGSEGGEDSDGDEPAPKKRRLPLPL